MKLFKGRINNNKLLALWADGDSAYGMGSTVTFSTKLRWSDKTDGTSALTVAYTLGNNTVSQAPIPRPAR